jgi:predicted AAA+ superfamily ATPase
MYRRNLIDKVSESIRFSSATLINGARQTGKSTFLQQAFVGPEGFSYVNLDDLNLLRLAKSDPITFLSQQPNHTAIDEIQRTPELLLPMKKLIDEARATRRFLLTGSANVLTLPKLSESLSGRMEIHTLWPLSQGEILGRKERFPDFIFSNETPTQPTPLSQEAMIEAIIMGGYPEALLQMKAGRGPEWFRSYLATLLQRDVQQISNIEGLAELPHLLQIIASRAGNLINFADISRTTKLNAVTLKRYYTLLQRVYLINEVPAWSTNHEKRLVKSPKVFLNDSGLLCYLRGLNTVALHNERSVLGGVLENFVVMELTKQLGWAEAQYTLTHFRDQAGHEVDVVLESMDKRIVGIEIKASMDIRPCDFNGIRFLAKTAGEHFHRGFLLYMGSEVLRYDENLWALPVSAIWE